MSVGTAMSPASVGPGLQMVNPHHADFASGEPGPSETHKAGLSPLLTREYMGKAFILHLPLLPGE